MGTRLLPWLLQAGYQPPEATVSRGALVLLLPSVQNREQSQGAGGKSKSGPAASRGDGFLRRPEAAATSISLGSCFHHSDERHGLWAGGLGYPDAAQVLGLGPVLGAEVAMTDLFFYQVFHPVVHL